MKKNSILLLAILLVSVLVLSACGGANTAKEIDVVPAPYTGKTNPLAGDANAIAAGKVVYEAKCASCHGVSGKGDGPAGSALTPPAANLVEAVSDSSVDFLYYRIAEGGAMEPYNSAMPANKSLLSEDEIWQVVSYISTIK